MIAAAFLYQFGTTPIRGFATTLAIGLLANVFTAVFVSRTLFEIALKRPTSTLGIGGSQIFANARLNFTRWRWHAMVLSLIVIGAGMATVTKGVPLGIDFTGGTLVVVEFPQEGVTEERVFGGEALRGFAFTMLVGIVAGTYSTVFIASATATLLAGTPGSRKRLRSTKRDDADILPVR